jgi:hypothetical protein
MPARPDRLRSLRPAHRVRLPVAVLPVDDRITWSPISARTASASRASRRAQRRGYSGTLDATRPNRSRSAHRGRVFASAAFGASNRGDSKRFSMLLIRAMKHRWTSTSIYSMRSSRRQPRTCATFEKKARVVQRHTITGLVDGRADIHDELILSLIDDLLRVTA